MNTYTNTQPVYQSTARPRYAARPKGRKGAIARLTVLAIVSIIGILSSICTLPGFVESRGLGPAILEAIGGCGTLLMLAAATGNAQIFRYFSLQDFDLFHKNKSGKTVLDIAVEKNASYKYEVLQKMDSLNLEKVIQELKKIKSQDFWSFNKQAFASGLIFP